ncbi:TetR/AcrR family transcriptional regulator [Ancylobacter mangrovi]|uniref:TetR/AcrR family transcriptional regulator n=1 Tax=Ancylobacter mangrovi TaxID=2972472 RepID=UPI002161D4D2|nr:TetR/AcrR family transcriptional regulator [Ancylobacter mangrovi]MCS0503390.1 TetR/AcrR family transcriptional regulator [Ancylobacter mangrovi]
MSLQTLASATAPARYKAGTTDTRAAIVSVAERWCRRVGFRRTAVADIAAELGMSPSNVFRFFSSKAVLGDAVAERVLGGIVETLHGVAARSDLAPPDRLRALLLAWVETTATVLGTDDHMRELIEAGMGESWKACVEHTGQIDRLLRLTLESGAASGDFAVRDVAVSVGCVRAAMLAFTYPGLLGQAAPDTTPRQIVAFVLYAVSVGRCAPPSAWPETARRPRSFPATEEPS